MQNKLTRRQFLRTSILATATAPLVLTAPWAAFGQKGPNDRITMGIIGTGTQGRGLMNDFLNQPGTQVVAVCDVDTTRREHNRKKVEEFYTIKADKDFKGCTAYKDFRNSSPARISTPWLLPPRIIGMPISPSKPAKRAKIFIARSRCR